MTTQRERFAKSVGPLLVLSIALLVVGALTWGFFWGLIALPVFWALTILSMVVFGLNPRERARKVMLEVSPEHVALSGEGADVRIPMQQICGYRVRDGARKGAVCLSLLTDFDVTYVEFPAQSAGPILEVLDRQLPSALGETSLRPELPRRGRSLEEWAGSVRALARTGGYRDGRGNISPLLDAVRDPRLGAEERLGAALAVASGADVDSRARLRDVARAVSQKRLRIALLRVAEGAASEEDLSRAVETDGFRFPEGHERFTG
ncbi:MAG: hypothetical protein U0441_31255 [Polyangiaceae bacterium]